MIIFQKVAIIGGGDDSKGGRFGDEGNDACGGCTGAVCGDVLSAVISDTNIKRNASLLKRGV